jgi:hypothetical protein
MTAAFGIPTRKLCGVTMPGLHHVRPLEDGPFWFDAKGFPVTSGQSSRHVAVTHAWSLRAAGSGHRA